MKQTMKTIKRIIVFVSLGLIISLAQSARADDPLAADAPTASGPSEGEAQGESTTELNKKLSNPVSDIWSISFQQNNYVVDPEPGIPNKEERWNSNLAFQPVLPIALTDDWNLITRPVVTLFNSTPYPSISLTGVDIERTTSFGDIILMEMLSPSPKLVGNWLLGVGPTFIFPTASSNYTGQGKFQVGPAAVVGYLSKKWILGAFVQNWSSFAGNSRRPDANQMNLQPIASCFFGQGWSIGYSGNVLANWEAAKGRDVWTVPVGLGINKVVKFGKLPVKIGLAGQYMPVHPDTFGQRWNIQLQITPVLPKLITGNLFGN
jgi:hypothetical protein